MSVSVCVCVCVCVCVSGRLYITYNFNIVSHIYRKNYIIMKINSKMTKKFIACKGHNNYSLETGKMCFC